MNDSARPVPVPSGSNGADVSAFMVCEDLWRLLKMYKKHVMRIADSYGLTMIQFSALYAIAEQEQGKATMGKVAQTLHCDASNATGIVDRLTALKLVIRQDNPSDRRVKSLLLTPLGDATLHKVLDEMPSALGCDRLDAAERKRMHRMVGKLADEPL